jgi:TetR/AcrR family transcriptional repressor of nem operon
MAVDPPTEQGRATRERIVAATSRLVAERGVAATSLDDVLAATRTSKSQLYHYFEDRAELLRAVVSHNTEGVLNSVGPLDSWKAIRAWFDALVELQAQRRGRWGCPIGSLVSQLAEADPQARKALADSFARWERDLRDGLNSLQLDGKLDRRADPGELATATMAAIQGGLLLTQAKRDPRQLAIALDAAYSNLRAHASSARDRRAAGRQLSRRP